MQMEAIQNGKIFKIFYCISSTIYSVIELLSSFSNFQVFILLWLSDCTGGYRNLLETSVRGPAYSFLTSKYLKDDVHS